MVGEELNALDRALECMAPEGMRSSVRLAAIAAIVLVVLMAAWGVRALLSTAVEQASLVVTLRLALQVAFLSTLLAVVPTYAIVRHGPGWNLLAPLVLASLLIPTLARSISLSALLSYYGPVATFARSAGLWPESAPLESSHFAVVAALSTIYVPLSSLVIGEALSGLGRTPEVAAALGARPLVRLSHVVLPHLAGAALTAALIVFSQVLGVIVTPRVLGADDVTLAMLGDDYLKRSLQRGPALRIGLAQLLLALPAAAAAGLILAREKPLARSELRRSALPSHLWWLAALPLAVTLIVPVALVMLSVTPGTILAPAAATGPGEITLHWYRTLAADAAWRSTLVPSIAVWGSASLLACTGALLIGAAPWRSALPRYSIRFCAMLLMFLPQNALGLVLFNALQQVPTGVVGAIPGWLLAGVGQALVALPVAVLLLDVVAARLARQLAVAATLRAGWLTRSRRVFLPAVCPAMMIALLVSALFSLDDVIFVRYLPLRPLQTVSTMMFEKAMYGAAPDLAAAAVVIALCTGAAGAIAFRILRKNES